jgi:hypothetical protein
MNTKRKLTSSLIVALLGFSGGTLPLSAQTTILSDDFSSGVRNVQNLPDQAAWYSAGPGNRLFANSANGGSMTLNQVNNGGENTGAMVYFTNSGALTIPNGGSITVSFDFSVSGVFDSNNNRLWVGLYNSHGSRLTADGEVTAAGTSPGNRFMDLDKFAPYTGYEAAFNIDRNPEWEGKTDSTTSRLYRRPDNTGQRLFTAGGNTQVPIGNENPETMRQLYLEDGETYSLTYTISRFETSDHMQATLTISGGNLPGGSQTMTGADPSMIENSFDTFGIWQSRFVTSEAAFSGEFVFDNFNVTFVPEPASATMLFGVMALAAGIVLRRRRK